MSSLNVTGSGAGYTQISNLFIDYYMLTAGASNVKTYLLLIRMFSDPQQSISVERMADILDCSESDVLRSFRYWEKRGLLRLELGADGKSLQGIQIVEPDKAEKEPHEAIAVSSEREEKKPEPAAVPLQPEESVPSVQPVQSVQNEVEKEEEIPLPPRNIDMPSVLGDENFSRVLFIAEQYIGAPISQPDCEIFAWLYEGMHMEPALLEYLVEYCVTNNHKSVRYMEAVAIDWHRKQISTVEQARIYTPLHNKNLYAVMKALGLSNRQPAPSERKIIDRWFQEYGFSLDMVEEACNRTMVSIHEPNLNYVESILARWKDAGITSLEQLRALDEQHQKEKETKESRFAQGAQKPVRTFRGNSKPGAQFHNFEQRQYNYDELLRQINGTGVDN